MSKNDYYGNGMLKPKEEREDKKPTTMSCSSWLAYCNNQTYKQNNGKYPDRPYK